ncbi:glycogen branching protein [candidate division MSBL1 archaeon SCGC-AAA382A20]|uniref:1,4-alpha-glucan branching enzyme n=1 Tax=candidate division MSBL1 archaeon SCGC-AAA382A20 TaxID=1698280 RepID=A0A133VL54_9EURY|nr:glycogen branching protein [candidate division MSBL1 archaeon SCGC-AAA382A20]
MKYGESLLNEHDIYLFKQGNHFRLYEKLGAHVSNIEGGEGTYFGVWAPNASEVSVIGDFNDWKPKYHPLKLRKDSSGIWEGFIQGLEEGELYKYHIVSQNGDYTVEKSDPLAFHSETPPKTASIIRDLDYSWSDKEWMNNRAELNSLSSPFSIYEMHFGSWRRPSEDEFPNFRDIASDLVEYLNNMGFTHVEFMPLMEHPFYGSWGYQISNYFAPTSRYGEPEDLMYLIDVLHQNDIGVIMDWVPSHFPTDEHSLVYFDGTHLYEYEDMRKGYHPDWNSYIFDYGRDGVRNFLVSSAMFWLDKYHIDGLRVDGVASMLYLDYSRDEGQWVPNKYGGRENLEAIDFIKSLNKEIYRNYPDVQMIAEESTAWPMVSRPTSVGGLGFGMKWNMGWMHDTLEYFSKDPIYRKHHQDELTFSFYYTFDENFVLSLSHDEVVHGKGSLLSKMPGDDWQKFANLKLLLGYTFAHPGKKLIFMGGEFGQWEEWNHDGTLNWVSLQYSPHKEIQKWVKDLNQYYKRNPVLYENDFNPNGFEFNFSDKESSVISFSRRDESEKKTILIVCNLTPVVRENYRIGVDSDGYWEEVLNSDAEPYGGSGQGNLGGVEATPVPYHSKDYSVSLTLPPLGILFLEGDL